MGKRKRNKLYQYINIDRPCAKAPMGDDAWRASEKMYGLAMLKLVIVGLQQAPVPRVVRLGEIKQHDKNSV